jgi:hypothetical protein
VKPIDTSLLLMNDAILTGGIYCAFTGEEGDIGKSRYWLSVAHAEKNKIWFKDLVIVATTRMWTPMTLGLFRNLADEEPTVIVPIKLARARLAVGEQLTLTDISIVIQ